MQTAAQCVQQCQTMLVGTAHPTIEFMDFDTLENLTPGKTAAVALFFGLMAASFTAWGLVLVQRLHGETPVPPGPPERRTWSNGMSFVAIAIVLPLQALALAQIGRALLTGKSLETAITLETVRASCAINAALVLVLLALPVLISGPRWTDFGIVANSHDFLYGALGFAASWLPVCAVNLAVGLIGWREPDGMHPFLQLLAQDGSIATIAWITFSVVVLAPLAEELVYRVILQGWLEQHLPAWAAIAISATVFAAVHTSPGRPDSIPLLPLALILGVIYHRRRSLPAVMLIHALFNGAMLQLAVLAGS
jgi:membrane protease YdiL (CAAX protease family)